MVWIVSIMLALVALSVYALALAHGARMSERLIRAELRRSRRRATPLPDSALHANEERLRLALEAADLGISDQDLTSDDCTLSPLARRQLGLPDYVPGTFETFMECVHPEDRARTRQAMIEGLRFGEYAVDFRVVWPDGSVHHVRKQARLFSDTEGRPTRMVGVLREIGTAHQRRSSTAA